MRFINKHTVVLAGRDTGRSRNIENSLVSNDGAVVLVRGREGGLDGGAEGGLDGGADVGIGAGFIICCCC
jgi:hypothetical protein